jgi:hypothetical protein
MDSFLHLLSELKIHNGPDFSSPGCLILFSFLKEFGFPGTEAIDYQHDFKSKLWN